MSLSKTRHLDMLIVYSYRAFKAGFIWATAGPVSSVGRANSDFGSKGPGFESRPRRQRIVYPWARHFIRIAQQLKSEMIRLCGTEVKNRVSRIFKYKS